MTGTEHYLEAERLLNRAHTARLMGNYAEADSLVLAATAHAALGQIAATYAAEGGARGAGVVVPAAPAGEEA